MPTPAPQSEPVIPDQMGHKKGSYQKHGILKQYGYPAADSVHPDAVPPTMPYPAGPYTDEPIIAPSAFPPPPIVGEPPVYPTKRSRAATPFIRPAAIEESSSSSSEDSSSSSSSSDSSDHEHRYRVGSATPSFAVPPPMTPARTPSASIPMPQPSATPHLPPPPPPVIPQQSESPSPPMPNPGHPIRSVSPTRPSAYGPPPHHQRRALKNPLPPPPRDVYDLAPYKSVREMSETTNFILRGQGIALKSGHITVPETIVPGILNPPHNQGKDKKKGIFKAFGSLGKKPEPRVVPVYIPAPEPPHIPTPQPERPPTVPVSTHGSVRDGSTSPQSQNYAITQTPLPNSAPVRPPSRSTMQSQTTHRGAFDVEIPSHSSRRDSGSQSTSSTIQMPVIPPPVASSTASVRIGRPEPLPIPFSHTTPYSSFLNHSKHRVMYENQTYPTAIHLHEALRFLPDHPEIAERIRESADPAEAYRISAWGQEKKLARSDWKRVWMEMMDKVLLLKFQQHPKLRAMLINTGEAELIYADEDDAFWGRGPIGEGKNELGKALMRVRAQLTTRPDKL